MDVFAADHCRGLHDQEMNPACVMCMDEKIGLRSNGGRQRLEALRRQIADLETECQTLSFENDRLSEVVDNDPAAYVKGRHVALVNLAVELVLTIQDVRLPKAARDLIRRMSVVIKQIHTAEEASDA